VHLWGPPLRLMIAMPDSPIGWPVGQWRKKIGVVTMPARVAPLQPEGVLELELLGMLDSI